MTVVAAFTAPSSASAFGSLGDVRVELERFVPLKEVASRISGS
ncbi:hypothetical protein N0B31_11555 [Salinirubellus salinus]|uniref:Uncharacterized protein n=1 Tax=Salinirubellus salinus TaxID=1364945 RepID=A0A9E7U980_9EURY|nr:hypothetical protein [Salinirubellus salinus]UWM52787.1 hypothetical protein N0B31_11555 [Salinirubellus salinus]